MSPKVLRKTVRPVLPPTSTLGKRNVGTSARLVPFDPPMPPTYHPQPRKHSPSPTRTRNHTYLRTTYDKQIAVLIIVLVIAGLASLFTAYYLFTATSRSLLHPSHDVKDTGALQTALVEISSSVPTAAFVESVNHLSFPAEKFLAYLPHSGFHNQRIALENALVLARILNRTLLLPPVRLGDPLSYAPFDELYETSADNRRKIRLGFCRDLSPADLNTPSKCDDYFRYTHISWDWLVDLSSVRDDQRLLEGWNYTDAWLQHELDISTDDIFYIKDSTRNEYSFQDFFSFDPPARKFFQAVQIATLAHRPERLIQLGTLFGSSRLHLRSSTNYVLRQHVRESMAFANLDLVRAADGIRTALGGAYLGVHLRIGDGVFEWNAPENTRLAWWKLLHLVLGFAHDDILALERELFPDDAEPAPPTLNIDYPALRAPHPPLPPFPLEAAPLPDFPCRGPLHTSPRLTSLNAPLFVSTDARSPAHNGLLVRFTRTFPCIFFLDDFPEDVASLRDLKSPVDGVPLCPFLMPFLDAMVVGQAWQVVGTEQSTFSAFVTDVLWRTYHGFEIVQRG